MRIAHVADTHLGAGTGDMFTRTGQNQRAADISLTFSRLIDALIVVEPDVVVFAGDTFDRVRPQNQTLVDAMNGFGRLRDALPATDVVLISGNHDAAKDFGGGCVLPIFRQLGVQVVDREAMRIRFPARDCSILCVPDAPGIGRPELRPDPDSRFNVLLLHGEVAGVTQGGADMRPRITDISPDELAAPEWDYIALGHYHVMEQVADASFYAGAIDFTSSNIWAESKAGPKGFIVRDLEDGAHEFIELPASRRVLDLDPVHAGDMAAAEIDAAIARRMEAIDGGFDGAFVRLVVTGVTRETQTALDYRPINKYRSRCFQFRFDVRKPERVDVPAVLGRSGRGRQPLDDIVRDRLGDAIKTPLPPDVDRAALIARAMEYVRDAYGDAAVGPMPSTESTEPAPIRSIEAA